MGVPYHRKALQEGSLLREWRLERVLGVGGFGIVYKGRGVYFDEDVAIKEYFPSAISDRIDGTTVAPTDSSSEEVYSLGLHKFMEEAKVLWNLSKPERHPNIVSVRSLFEVNGTAYMVMDFERGQSLSEMLKAGRKFTEAELRTLIRPIAEGLDRAHKAGVLHRDIKPANMLVSDDGRPVLIDFGSARFDTGQATSTKVTFYTPPYAAIEQYVKTYPQGPWTDVYALGVTLAECVAGGKPHDALERIHGAEDRRLASEAHPGFGKPFLGAIDAAMALRPADRPQSISQWLRMFDEPEPVQPPDDEATRIAVRADLEPQTLATTPVRSLAEEPKAAPPPAVPEKASNLRNLVIGGLGGLFGLGAVFLGYFMAHKPPPVPAVAAAPKVAPAAVAALAPAPAAPGYGALVQGLGDLLADAKAAGRPQGEIGALATARDKAAALAGRASSLEGAPDEAKDLAGQLGQIVSAAAFAETAALRRDADAQLRDVQRSAMWQVSTPDDGLKPLRQAKADLDAAIAGVSRDGDPASSIAGTRRALAQHQAFVQALATAGPAILAAQRQAYAVLDAADRQAAAQVQKLAGGAKPWMFASKAVKEGYKQAQANAARAAALVADLDALNQQAQSATKLKPIAAAVARAGEIRQELESLRTSTAAAVHSQPGLGRRPPDRP